MVNESASKIKQDNTTQMILVKNNNRQGNLGGLSILLYISIKVYCTAVLGCRDQLRVLGQNGIWYCDIS